MRWSPPMEGTGTYISMIYGVASLVVIIGRSGAGRRRRWAGQMVVEVHVKLPGTVKFISWSMEKAHIGLGWSLNGHRDSNNQVPLLSLSSTRDRFLCYISCVNAY